MLVNKLESIVFLLLKQSRSEMIQTKQIPSDHCDILIRPIRMVTKVPMVNEGLMDVDADAENEAEPVLQLFVVQHDVTAPAAVVPVEVAVHVVPDGTHEYALVADPDNQVETVLNKLEL
jgi:hypothetical protein